MKEIELYINEHPEDFQPAVPGEIKLPVLGLGYVRHRPDWIMGTDLDIVNDARTSFDAEHAIFYSKADSGLVNFLGSHQHTSCFRGISIKFELYMPLMTARQVWKYIIGSQHVEELQSDEYCKYQDSFTNWNETSRRYVKEKMEFYLPGADQWRSNPDNRKQGSGGLLPLEVGQQLHDRLQARQNQAVDDFIWANDTMDAAAEQARLFLPAYGLMIRARWTASLQTVCHAINQRVEKSAQAEVQPYFFAIYQIVKHHFQYGLNPLLTEDAKKALAAAVES